MIYAKGAYYTGQFQNGLQHGQGRACMTDGSVYVGDFENNKKHGQGKYTTQDG